MASVPISEGKASSEARIRFAQSRGIGAREWSPTAEPLTSALGPGNESISY